jgi:HlyD family secretion protein
VSSTISATGTVEPEEVVDVGAQVAGRIKTLGDDPRGVTEARYKGKTVDYRSPAVKGAILATIDDSVYRAQRDQAKATLEKAKADVLQAKAKLVQAKQEFDRAQRLREIQGNAVSNALVVGSKPLKAISDVDYDTAVANYEIAKANVSVCEEVVRQNDAILSMAEVNLGYTVIKSPVDGVIIDRRINVGQTVVASLNAPSLFLIARDLRKMQVWASVNEADIGRIRPDMAVHFTVDAFPGETFTGRVEQIRLNATMNQNVVTYTVIVAFANADQKVLPYLTANLHFEIERRTNVLLVPNSALRWRPRVEQVSPESRTLLTAGKSSGGKAAAGKQSENKAAKGGDSQEKTAKAAPSDKPAKGSEAARSRIWVVDDAFVRPISVRVGVTDGTETEVWGEGLTPGMEVVVGEATKENAASDDTKNPFAPPRIGGAKKTP